MDSAKISINDKNDGGLFFWVDKDTFAFTIDNDEIYGLKYLWLNWGIFDSSFDDDQGKVYGGDEPFLIQNSLFYSDFYDREFMFIIFGINTLASIFSVLGWPIQIFLTLLLEAYLFYLASYSLILLLFSD